MLVTDKAKTLRLVAKNVEKGKLRFSFKSEDETYIMMSSVNKFKSALMVWLERDQKDLLDEKQKKFTEQIFSAFMSYRLKGFLIGEISEEDPLEINNLKEQIKQKDDEIMNLRLKIARLEGMLEVKQQTEIPNDTLSSEVDNNESS